MSSSSGRRGRSVPGHRRHHPQPGRLTVTGLSARRRNVGLLVRQARLGSASDVAVADAAAGPELREALPGVEVLVGPLASTELAGRRGVDVVLNGVTGSVWSRPDAGGTRRGQHAGAGQQGSRSSSVVGSCRRRGTARPDRPGRTRSTRRSPRRCEGHAPGGPPADADGVRRRPPWHGARRCSRPATPAAGAAPCTRLVDRGRSRGRSTRRP